MEASPSVMIVDDDASLCKSMSFVLKRKGYTVATAKDGPQAIEQARQRPFTMIFLDLRMPQLNGLETYKRIKKVRPGARVTMMTAYSVEGLVEEALREGAYGVLYKPLDLEQVVSLIEKGRGAGRLILVVDDDPGTCTTLRKILARRGHKVGVAHTGEVAVRMARKMTYEVVFIDMMLPKMNGLETYLSIKEVSPEATCVMITGHGSEVAELIEDALKKSAYACLYKPLDLEALFRVIDEVGSRARKAR